MKNLSIALCFLLSASAFSSELLVSVGEVVPTTNLNKQGITVMRCGNPDLPLCEITVVNDETFKLTIPGKSPVTSPSIRVLIIERELYRKAAICN